MSETNTLQQMPAPSALFADDEDARLRVLAEFDAGGLEDDPELEAIVQFAARLCGVPASMVTLIDGRRQYFLARTGVEERETPRELAFCTYALGRSDMMEVPDATLDPRFAANPLVTGWPGVRFYAGQPLVSDEGAPLGTLCVIDLVPHGDPLNEFQRQGLAVMAGAAMRRLRSRRAGLAAGRAIERSELRFRALAESMPDIAFSADDSGRIDYSNQRWQQFTGQPDGLSEALAPQLLHPDEQASVMAKWQQALATGAAYEDEYRLRRSDGQWRWVLARARLVDVGQSAAGQSLHRWFGTITDVDDAHKLSQTRDTLARELAHRIQNIFAVVNGLLSLEARKQPEHRPFADSVTETLLALGRAHDYVRPASGATSESLLGLLHALFAPYRDAAGKPRVTVQGADVPITPDAATPLALVFHELATNATKYGALSVPGGTVSLDIAGDDTRTRLSWQEHGGPQPAQAPSGTPDTAGFGSRLVELAVTGQMQGQWQRHFAADGLVVELDLPREALSQ